jgi:hypothetical protein
MSFPRFRYNKPLLADPWTAADGTRPFKASSLRCCSLVIVPDLQINVLVVSCGYHRLEDKLIYICATVPWHELLMHRAEFLEDT